MSASVRLFSGRFIYEDAVSYLAARTGVEPDFIISQLRVILAETCGNQRVNCIYGKWALCTIAQNYAVRLSEFVRKAWRANHSGNRGKGGATDF
jgi:hypothetical protein